jgi:hypothetical protein
MSGLSHRIDKRILTDRGTNAHPIPKHVRLTAILLRWQGSQSGCVHVNQKLLDRAEAWGITEPQFHAAVKSLQAWLIVPESTAKTIRLAPAPKPGEFVLAPEILLASELNPWVIQAVLSILAKPADKTSNSFYLNRKGKGRKSSHYPALIDLVPQTRATRSRGSRMAEVDQLVDALFTSGLVRLHATGGGGRWASEVLVAITPGTIGRLVAQPGLSRSVIPRPTTERHPPAQGSVIPRPRVASSPGPG